MTLHMTNKFDAVYETALSRRSIRRFKQKSLNKEFLEKFVNAARLAPSAANLQPLEFFIVDDKKLREQVFEATNWAGYIKPKWTPVSDERPVAYIVILVKDRSNTWYKRDASYAAANIVLAAESLDIGSCVLCAIDRDKIREYLKIPEEVMIDSLIALGYKAEHPVAEDVIDSIKYWRDEKEVLHVPKRKLKDITHYNKY